MQGPIPIVTQSNFIPKFWNLFLIVFDLQKSDWHLQRLKRKYSLFWFWPNPFPGLASIPFYWRSMVLEAITAFCSDEGWKPGTRNWSPMSITGPVSALLWSKIPMGILWNSWNEPEKPCQQKAIEDS